MTTPNLLYIAETSEFFSIGRALQRAIGKSNLGEVTLQVSQGMLTIDSRWGGGQIACKGAGEITAALSASAFCSLITSRFREKAPSGPMRIVFRPGLKEVALEGAGVKCKFRPNPSAK
jgi:hypothetical protein